MNYYNEIDPFAASWLERLIEAGAIAPGIVDRRSIEDVRPEELVNYTQCHFFAGIGVWSYALRLAGWPDDRPVWTGSCPCQPFSTAGRQRGFADERHLWPAFYWLISQCRPAIVLGEQVAGRAGESWLDLVSNDLEAQDYACGAVTFPACSVGAPHIRQRMYWVADSGSATGQWNAGSVSGAEAQSRGKGVKHGGMRVRYPDDGETGSRVADSCEPGLERHSGDGDDIDQQGRVDSQPDRPVAASGGAGGASGLADSEYTGHSKQKRHAPEQSCNEQENRIPDRDSRAVGFWDDCGWLPFRDGKYRPVEPGSFPLVDGATNRMGRLRGYGNAIVAPQAEIFIRAVRCTGDI